MKAFLEVLLHESRLKLEIPQNELLLLWLPSPQIILLAKQTPNSARLLTTLYYSLSGCTLLGVDGSALIFKGF